MAVNKQPYRLIFQWDQSIPAKLVSGKFTQWARVHEGGVLETEYETPARPISFEDGQPGVPLSAVLTVLQQSLTEANADLQNQLTAAQAQRTADVAALQAQVDALTVELDQVRRGQIP
jgi:hypothetical protein